MTRKVKKEKKSAVVVFLPEVHVNRATSGN